MANLEFRVDLKAKSLVKVTESVTTPEELRAELQAEADAAQNRLNAAREAKTQSEAAVVSATELDDANQVELEAAEQEVQFSSGRIAELDEAISVLDELVGATPEGENAGNDQEAVAVPVHAADVAPA